LYEEESSQKITELEALCKKLREDNQQWKEEKATLEGMVESHNELLMEITRETVTESPQGGVRRRDQLERFSAKREHNQHTSS
jgi:hypothetical protein